MSGFHEVVASSIGGDAVFLSALDRFLRGKQELLSDPETTSVQFHADMWATTEILEEALGELAQGAPGPVAERLATILYQAVIYTLVGGNYKLVAFGAPAP